MNLFAVICACLLRAALAGAIIYHLLKRKYKPVMPAALAFMLMYAPSLLERFFSFRLDPASSILYYAVIIMTVYLGNSLKFYDRFAWWDYAIHIMSGCLFVGVGVALAGRITGLGRFPVLFFSFALSMALHVAWEMLEYGSDRIFRTDHQRWQRHNPTHNHQTESAVQPAGLADTMNDTLACIAGTAASCLAWWFII